MDINSHYKKTVGIYYVRTLLYSIKIDKEYFQTSVNKSKPMK